MATERLAMNKVREILRLRWQLKLTVREAARSVGVSSGVVSETTTRATKAGLTWAEVEGLDEQELEKRIYGPAAAVVRGDRPRPDPVQIHTELRRPYVTLELLHHEYLGQYPNGFGYTTFCEAYRSWLATTKVTMRQVHTAGEKCFVDHSGGRPAYVDPHTGEPIEVELFVAVLGASNYTYAEATPTQQVHDFVASHVRAFAFFEGVSEMVVPDQLKSAVVRACRYEPGIQRTYAELARHCGTAIVPARPYKPRDKSKVEVGVQVVQRWILARLRRETFFSIEALNIRIREMLMDLNARPMRKLGGVSRRELFDRYERPALRPLPTERFEYGEWKRVTVNLDYHAEVDKHWYSAPYRMVHQEIWARFTATTVEFFPLHLAERIASHPRSYVPYKHTTDPAHMPESHRRHSAGVDAVIAWAASVGPMTEAMVRRLIDADPVREQGWRSARGLQRVGEKCGPERTELACARALKLGARSYKPVANILALGRENDPLPGEEPAAPTVIVHENVRGPGYYH